MTILAIETATVSLGTALADETGLLAVVQLRAGRRHAELLNAVVTQVLDAAGAGFGDLDAVAVDVGPGLFTGIRVGVAAAKGFAVALGLPVVCLTSLEILASACAARGHDVATGVVDLRRGEVAWALPTGSGAARVSRHGPPAELAELLREHFHGGVGAAEPIVLAGDGALRYGEQLTADMDGKVVLAGTELAAPPVASLAVQGVAELAAARAIDPLQVLPVYLRDADVRINWTTRHDAPGREVAR